MVKKIRKEQWSTDISSEKLSATTGRKKGSPDILSCFFRARILWTQDPTNFLEPEAPQISWGLRPCNFLWAQSPANFMHLRLYKFYEPKTP